MLCILYNIIYDKNIVGQGDKIMNDSIEIKKMDDLADDVNLKVAHVFVDAYYDLLCSMTEDKEKLIASFKDAFVKDVFYLALIDGEVVGMLACSNNKHRAVNLNRSSFIKSLGFLKGNFAYFFISNEFHKKLDYDDDATYIEFVATTSQARGKGVATKLFKHVIENSGYNQFTLDVIDTNEKALSIYRKLGFKEFKRTSATYFEKKIFNYKIYMKLSK